MAGLRLGYVIACPDLIREFHKLRGPFDVNSLALQAAAAQIDHPEAARELAHFGHTGFAGDNEGIAIYSNPDGTGYVVCTDQLAGNSHYHFYRREGGPAGPHDHSEMVRCVRGGADVLRPH